MRFVVESGEVEAFFEGAHGVAAGFVIGCVGGGRFGLRRGGELLNELGEAVEATHGNDVGDGVLVEVCFFEEVEGLLPFGGSAAGVVEGFDLFEEFVEFIDGLGVGGHWGDSLCIRLGGWWGWFRGWGWVLIRR